MIKAWCGMLIEKLSISKNNKRITVIASFGVALYTSSVIYLSLFDSLKYCYILPIACGLICCGMLLCEKKTPLIRHSVSKEHTKTRSYFALCLFFIVLFGQIIFCLAYYPGGFNLDAYGQWDQAHGLMQLNNWHPVFTTIIYRMLTMISDSLAFCIFVQIILFSFSISYLYNMLLKMGIPRALIALAALYTGLNPAISMNNICLYKDVYYTIMLILMSIFLIKIVKTHGEWLKPIWHTILVVFNLSVMAFIRHNWIFYSIPLLALMAMIYKKHIKRVLAILFATLALTVAVQGPLFSLLKVQRHSNTVGEMVGVPMAAMANVFVTDYENTPEEVKEFLLSIADKHEWESRYITGEWDSCKWEFGGIELFKDQSLETFMLLLAKAVKASPNAVYKSIRENTRVVWQVFGAAYWDTWVYIEDNDYGITPKPVRLLEKASDRILSFSLTKLGSALSWNIGIPNLIFVFLMWIAVARKEYEKLLYSVPIIAYNLLTMLLLCGASHRYFYFNSVLVIPFILAFLTDNKKSKNGNPEF